MKLVGYQQPICLCAKMEFVVRTISLSCELFSLSKARAGLKPVHLMKLYWAPRHGGQTGCSFLPDNPCDKQMTKDERLNS